MTRRLYLHRDDLDMNVDVVGGTRTPDSNFDVVLSATLFYPQGGGQPSDVGTIGEANVIRVIQVGDMYIRTVQYASIACAWGRPAGCKIAAPRPSWPTTRALLSLIALPGEARTCRKGEAEDAEPAWIATRHAACEFGR
ncbi:Alanine--tRNA ligase [Caballeronia udeis]|uniref:Alanine--tRNA ligase n=1 Tax=Caballeronia udeis TaxID=1232866 RepID=A0A158JTB1_9BURK|nr:hypothetical protein [Caballeronia udeis]SAL71915.1 Alanine--tRNA ligase [Caballeronia udeis]